MARSTTKGPIHSNRAPDETKLKQIIATIAPQITENGRARAFQQLNEAVDDYRQTFAIYVPDKADTPVPTKAADRYIEQVKRGRRSNDSFILNRKALQKLQKHLALAVDSLSSLPPTAMDALYNTCGGPLGVLAQPLNKALLATEHALNNISKHKTHCRLALVVLAGDVARVAKEELDLPISVSRYAGNITGKRCGGAYDRLLRATIQLAGLPATEDLLALMKAGKKHFGNPRGDRIK